MLYCPCIVFIVSFYRIVIYCTVFFLALFFIVILPYIFVSVAGGTGESSRGLAVGGMGQGVSEQEDVATAGDVCVL